MDQITDIISIQTANLTADKIPPQVHTDFRLSFYLCTTGESGHLRRIADVLQQTYPAIQKQESYGGHTQQALFLVKEADHPGACMHLVKIFRDAGVSVRAMGGSSFQSHPAFDAAPAAENIPDSFKDFESIKKLVASITP